RQEDQAVGYRAQPALQGLPNGRDVPPCPSSAAMQRGFDCEPSATPTDKISRESQANLRSARLGKFEGSCAVIQVDDFHSDAIARVAAQRGNTTRREPL